MALHVPVGVMSSNPVGLKTRKTYSDVTSTLLMISKHGSPPDLGQLGQYSLTIYNKYFLNADFWSYRKAFEFGKKIFKDKRTRRFAKGAGRFADGVDIGQQVASNFQSRGFEDAFDDLEAREPSRFKSAESVFFNLQ